MPPNNNPHGPSSFPRQVLTDPRSTHLPQEPTDQVQSPAQIDSYNEVPPPTDPEAGRYDFFLESQQPKKNKLRLTKPGRGPNVLLAWIGIIVVVMIVLAGLMYALGNSSKDKTPALTSVVKSQQLIIHTTSDGLKNLASQSLIAFATTANITITSAQQDLLTYISKHGGKVDAKLLAQYTEPRVDQVLSAAQSAGTYDETFRTTMQSILKDYIATLQQDNNSTLVPSEHEIIGKNLESAQILQQMLSQ